MDLLRITITIPDELLRRIDREAQQKLTSRSNVIRWAVQDYCEQHGLPRAKMPEVAQEDDDFSDLLARHPYVSPEDTELLNMYRNMEKEGYNL